MLDWPTVHDLVTIRVLIDAVGVDLTVRPNNARRGEGLTEVLSWPDFAKRLTEWHEWLTEELRTRVRCIDRHEQDLQTQMK